MTRIISWNVNGVRAVLKNGFEEWFRKSGADVLCLQETRVLPEQIDPKLVAPKGYASFWRPAKKLGYSGVATYSRIEPVSVETLGKNEFDDEGRVQLIEFPDFVLVNSYWPNSQPERKRIEYKLAFCRAIQRKCSSLRRKGKNVVICGDFNIAHQEIDLARPKQNVNNPGFLPEEREAMTRFLKAGFVDAFRHFVKDPDHYTWWSYRSGARAKNIGWRIDYHCVNKEFVDRVTQVEILNTVMGSDHCPVAITLRD